MIEWGDPSCHFGGTRDPWQAAVASNPSTTEEGGERVNGTGTCIGKRRYAACLTGLDGTVMEETGYENTYAAAAMFARRIKAMYGKCQTVCESTGSLRIRTYEARVL